MHEESFTFTWQVRNFSMCPVQMGECISSPVIRINKFKNSKWRLKLYPKGKFSEEAVACFLRCDHPGTNRSTVTAKFSLSVSSRIKTAENTFNTFACWGYPYFIFMKEIENEKDKYFPNDTLTIKCVITCMDQIEEVRTSTLKNNYFLNQCYIETTVHVETRSVICTVPRFQTRSCNKMLTLPVFSAIEECPSFEVALDLSESPTRIKIRKKNKFYDNMFLRCRVSVVNAEKDDSYSLKDEVLFKYEDRALKIFSVLNLSDLEKDYLDSSNSNLKLRFDFAFSIYGDVHHSERQIWNPVFTVPKSLPPVKVFSAPDEDHSVISVRAEDQTFQVHRSVLMAQSEVFRAMLANDMKEKETGVVDIVDVDPHVLNLLLEFLYTNSAPPDLSATDAAKLYAASNKYQIKSLTSICSSVIVSSLEMTNVFDVLELADLHQDERLLKYAREFVKVNSDFILVSKEWGDFMERSGTLAAKVLHKILIK